MKFVYYNHRGVTEEREVEVVALEAAYNPGYGYKPGWFLVAKDPSRGGEVRTFALDWSFMRPNTPPNPLSAITYPLVEAERVGQVKAAVDGLVAHASKQTSPEVSSLAGKYLALGKHGLAARLATARPAALGTMVEDFLSIFASALGQDEQK